MFYVLGAGVNYGYLRWEGEGVCEQSRLNRRASVILHPPTLLVSRGSLERGDKVAAVSMFILGILATTRLFPYIGALSGVALVATSPLYALGASYISHKRIEWSPSGYAAYTLLQWHQGDSVSRRNVSLR